MPKYCIESIEGRGRCLIAGKSFKKGDIILEEEPFAMVISQAYGDVACGYCGKLCINGVVYALNQEDSVKYCSEKCITVDYPTHELEVDALKLLKNIQLPTINLDSLKLIVRCGCLRANEKAEVGSSSEMSVGSHFKDVMKLESISNEMSTQEQKEFDTIIDKMEKICKIRKLPLNKSEIKSILFSIQCNAHRMTDNEHQQIALGLFPLISMINHSCLPNCTHYFEFAAGVRPKMIIRAITDIPEGEEVVYSYVPLYQSTKNRQTQLLSAYSFQCTCPRCSAVEQAGDASDVVDRVIEYPVGSAEERALLPLKKLLDDFSVYSTSEEETVESSVIEERLNGFLRSLFALSVPTQSTEEKSLHISATHKYMLQTNVVNSKLAAAFAKSLSAVSSSGTTEWDKSISLLRISVLFGLVALGCVYTHIEVVEFEAVQLEQLLAENLRSLVEATDKAVAGAGSQTVFDDVLPDITKMTLNSEKNESIEQKIVEQAVAALNSHGHQPPMEVVSGWRKLVNVSLTKIMEEREDHGAHIDNVYSYLLNVTTSYAAKRLSICRGESV